MIKNYFYFSLAIILTLIQTSFFSGLKIFHFAPSLIIAFLISLCFLDESRLAFFSALICGIIFDVYTANFFGMTALILLVLVMFVNLLLEKVFTVWGNFTRLFFSFAATLFYFIFNYLFLHITKIAGLTELRPFFSFSSILNYLVASLANYFLISFFFFAFEQINQLLERKFSRKNLNLTS